jgi:methionyl-tRNA formyltransferase
MTTRPRIVFMGTAELSCSVLAALLESPDCEVVGAVTQPDRPKGRDLKLTPPPVKEMVLKAALPLLQPERARDEQFIEDLRRLEPDLIAVAAYGQILPRGILDLPRLGCVNVHASLLPKYRGAAPVQWAILNGEKETGVTIMKMDAGLDTGDILVQETTPIRSEDTSETLLHRLAMMGASLLVRTIPALVAGTLKPMPQASERATHAPKIKKQDGLIDWRQPAYSIWNRVRGLVPWPGAFTYALEEEGRRTLKLWRGDAVEASGDPGRILKMEKSGILVACGTGGLRITELQREGGRRLTAAEFVVGRSLTVGQQLG